MERPAEASKTRNLERVKELDLEDLECRQELAEVLGLKNVSQLESTTLCRLVEGPRGAFLKSEDNGNSRLDWDPAEVGNGTNQL